MTLTKRQKEKVRILKLKERVKQRGDDARDKKWDKVLTALANQWYREVDKKKAEEKEKLLRVFEFRGKLFEYYENKELKL